MADDSEDLRRYKVIINDEEQYSLWLASKPTPGGWKDTGKEGSRSECMAYVDEVWTDMRPRSLREFMARTQSPTT
jgi:MbtH protein